MLTKVIVSVRAFFNKYHLLSNVVIYGSLVSSADITCQKLTSSQGQDWHRTRRLATVGATFLAPVNHFYFKILDRVLPGAAAVTVGKKLLVDSFIMTPICLVGYFFISAALEGKTVDQRIQDVRNKFAPAFKGALIIWPAAQTINFFFLPTNMRVVYIGSIAFFWQVFLSFVKHMDQHQHGGSHKSDPEN